MSDTPSRTPSEPATMAAGDVAPSPTPETRDAGDSPASLGLATCQRAGCGRPLPLAARLRGWPRRYCSLRCRRAAQHARDKGLDPALARPVRNFTPNELPPVTSLETALTALDAIRVAVLSGRITPPQGRSAAGAVESWVRAHGALTAQRVVNELRAELDAKGKEIATLRSQLGSRR